MCGILGILFQNVENHEALMCQIDHGLFALGHRGPDDKGSEFFSRGNNGLALGHARLSVIDLSPSGHQPMKSEDGRWTITFNGEIYNYRELRQNLQPLGHNFNTNSDTEVLLAAWSRWGVKCLQRLVGMFAFAIYDHQDGKLILVRDAFGIKPLFYTKQPIDRAWAFASELPAILALLPSSPAVNLQRAYDYLVYGSYDDQPATLFQGIEHLPAGHWLEISLLDGQASEPVRWWKPSITERSDLTFSQAAEEVRERFLSNIRLHLRSDVPLGAALSGGVDSSAVVCAIRHIEPQVPIHTFTFTAPGSAIDEESWADVVNNHVGAIAHKVHVSPAELAADLDMLIQAQGEPFGSTSIYAQYRVFRAARDAGITVTLDGQGADELLAGYDGYPHARLRSFLDHNRFGSALRFLQAWQQWPSRGRWSSLSTLAQAVMPEDATSLLKQLRYASNLPWLNVAWLKERGVVQAHTSAESMFSLPGNHGRRLSSALRGALCGSGLAALLRHGDRNSMHWSIESRVPFLTADLAEFMLSLPEDYLLSSSGETKHVFRAAMRGIVPDVILDRRDKIGFATPEQSWLQHLAPQFDSWLFTAQDIPFLRHDHVASMVYSTINGDKPFTWKAWRVINFCRWMQIFRPAVQA